jgi:hypothetical protein
MISLARFKSAIIEGGKRILKVEQFGAKTAKECYPFGFDSMPPENWTAIYADTANKDESVIIGYINKNQLAEAGGSRMYALGSFGEVVGFVRCGANGITELNGSAFSSVRFESLKIAIDNNDTLINTELAKIATAITALGGVYSPVSIETNLLNTKSETVKLK